MGLGIKEGDTPVEGEPKRYLKIRRGDNETAGSFAEKATQALNIGEWDIEGLATEKVELGVIYKFEVDYRQPGHLLRHLVIEEGASGQDIEEAARSALTEGGKFRVIIPAGKFGFGPSDKPVVIYLTKETSPLKPGSRGMRAMQGE